MSSGCVLMRTIFCRYFLFLISVFTELSGYAFSQPFIENNEIKFSGDFMKFVKDMGRIVYNRKEEKRASDVSGRPIMRRISTTARSMGDSRHNVNQLISQKDAIRNVLMMKLVSYYEDKYKLSNSKDLANLPKNSNYHTASGITKRYEPVRAKETTPASNTGYAAEVVVI